MKHDSQYQNNVCHKLDDDAYFTPRDVAIRCYDKFISMFGCDVSELVEPSAGNGVFLKLFDQTKPTLGIDINPKDESIVKADFLTYDMPYKKGRAFVGNPPFGVKGNLMRAFYNKYVESGDYIAFILPITQYKNTNFLFKFDLVYSEDLGNIIFSSSKKVHCCFNIYKRPLNGINTPVKKALTEVLIVRNDNKQYGTLTDFDFRVIGFGGRSGQILGDDERDLATTYKVKVLNPIFKDDVRNAIEHMDLTKYRKTTSVKKCQKVNLIDCILNNVKGIK